MPKGKIFYGWWVAIALFFVGMFGPMGRYTLTAFFPFISQEFGWTKASIGLAQSLHLIVYSIFALFVGFMIDRIGSRKVIFSGGAIILIALLLMSTINSQWQLYLYFSFIMAFGVGMAHVVANQATARKWFISRAGVVIGLIGAGFGLGNAVLQPLLTNLSSSLGWQTTSVICAISFGVIIMSLAVLVIRNTPESMGLKPDGDTNRETVKAEPIKDVSLDYRQAIKTPQFWLLFISYTALGIPIQGILSHLVMWGVDLGSSKAAAGIFMTALTLPSIPAKVFGGWLADRWGKKQILILCNILSILALLWGWLSVRNTSHLYAFAIVYGLVYGPTMVLYSPYLGDLFGRRYVATLIGILTMGHTFLGGFGPYIWGKISDVSGSYNAACLLSAICYGVSTLTLFLTRPIKRVE